LSAGFYTATFTATATGCKAEATFNILNDNSDLSATVSVADPDCHGETVTATINVTGGSSPFSYSLNGGTSQSSNTYAGLGAGNYNVLVTDNNGCTYDVAFSIDEPDELSILVVSTTDVDCNGAANGVIVMDATGGTAPYSYSSTGGVTFTGNTATGVSGGTYTITVTDANSCTANTDVTISEPDDALAVIGTETDPTCYGGSDGSIDITVSGGTSPYSYLWSDGQSSEDVSNLTSGNYTVTVTDANGCQVTSSTFTITDPTELVLDVDATVNTECNASVETDQTGTTATFTGLSAGFYTATFTATATGYVQHIE